MLRRYRSLKKIVYAATILFATIVLYAGTSSRDYNQDRSTEWVLPIVARDTYDVAAALQEPLHRLPLGPFEDHQMPIVVESLQMQIPTFEDSKSDDDSNNGPASHNNLTPKATIPASGVPGASKLPELVSDSRANIYPAISYVSVPEISLASGIPPASANLSVQSIPPAVGIPPALENPSVPGIPPALENPPIPGIPLALENHPAPGVPPASSNPPAPAISPAPGIHPAPVNALALENPPALANLPMPVNSADTALSSHQALPQVPVDQLVTLPGANPSLVLTGNIPQPKPQLPPTGQDAPQNPPLLPTKPLPDLNKTAAEILRRINHTRHQCEKFQVPNQIDSEIYQLPQYNFSYCKIPKAGCTYWEQVISFLNQPPYQLSYLGVKMPFQISKYDIRYTSHFNLPRRDFENDKADIMKSTRVLFVRHPLERLWSCYLEKFYLIDFWTTAGVSMKTSGADVKCPKSITFREFVDFTLPLFNENWAPMTELCNPCVFQPHIIGQVETLREDSYYTLKQLNLDWIFTEHDKFSREENQMLDMAIYNYQIHSIHWYSFYHKCLTQKELAAKLWDVFKKVGYLSSHAALPDNLLDYNQTTIIKELKLQFRKFPLGPINGRAQQLKMMKRDFESLPKPIMAKILERYAMDFQLFGYSTQLIST